MNRIKASIIILAFSLSTIVQTLSADAPPSIAELQKEIQKLKAENESLRQENAALKKQLLQGSAPRSVTPSAPLTAPLLHRFRWP